ncbi:hypothetical protein [Aliivibrio kagoshimensis]|uniref:hypothetical protein n=1 Tax=Aliivibrio kagoshimensis TaxID=2910230 RepID=UPI003D145959
MDFTEKLRLHGKAEEDLFFAKRDHQLIEALHEKQKLEEDMRELGALDDAALNAVSSHKK